MIVRLATHAMATRFELVLAGEDEASLRDIGEEAVEAIEEAARRLSWFDPGSLLSHVNRNAGDHAVRVDEEMIDLLTECRQVTVDSGGAFDITVASLMTSHGFRAGHEASARTVADGARSAVGMDGVEIDPQQRTVRFRDPGLSLDLGGVGKGHGLDLAASVLREHGVEAALLHGGTSSVLAIGAPPGASGWRVAISDTGRRSVVLRDAALSVSAPSGRTVSGENGERLGHVMDPRRGEPSTGVRLAAIVAPTARLADAWSTALVVLGEVPPSIPRELSAMLVPDDPTSRTEREHADDGRQISRLFSPEGSTSPRQSECAAGGRYGALFMEMP